MIDFRNIKKKLTVPLFGIIIFILLNASNMARIEAKLTDHAVGREDYNLLPAEESLPWLSLGYNAPLADIFWIMALQYNDFYNKGKQIESYANAVIALDPKFKSIYRWAAVNLLFSGGVTREGVEGANHFLERATKVFPDDAELFFRIGLNLSTFYPAESEEERRALRRRAVPYLLKAQQLPNASKEITQFISGILSSNGEEEQSAYVRQALISENDPEIRRILLQRLRIFGENESLVAEQRKVLQRDAWHEAHAPHLPLSLSKILYPQP